jgi:hypothetical protein
VLLQVHFIGPRRAQRLIDALGRDWSDALDLAPERVFRTLRGVGQAQARAAAESWARLSRDPRCTGEGEADRPADNPRCRGLDVDRVEQAVSGRS